MAQAATKPEAPAEPPRPMAWPESRLTLSDHTDGPILHLNLPADDRLEEGPQNVLLFAVVGRRLNRGQLIVVTNDGDSFWALMRVTHIHGGNGMSVRMLELRHVVPPQLADRKEEEVVATGEFYVRWMGSTRRYAIVAPNGTVRQDGFMTQKEAENARDQHARNFGRAR